MKLSEFIRYMEDHARDDRTLVFYSAVDPAFSTEGWDYITGDVGDYRAPLMGHITLSFRASRSGVPLRKDDFLGWLRSVKADYGNQKMLIRLHWGDRGSSVELLEDNLWGRVETSDGERFSIGSPSDGPGFVDYMNERNAEYGVAIV